MPNELGAVIYGYLDYCISIKKLAPRTVVDIKCTMNRFVGYQKERNLNREIWQLNLEEFVRWINARRSQGASPKNINKELSHLRGLIDYAWQMERADRNVLQGYNLKDAKRVRETFALTSDEAAKYVGAFQTKNFEERRSRLIILLLYGCGLRNSELCGLNIQDIDHERQEIKVLGKGPKERVIPLMDGIYTELLAYLKLRRVKMGALFKTPVKKTRVRQKDISNVVDEASARIGMEKKVTPMTFRHTFASHLADEGVDVAVIAKLMGHRTQRETDGYLHASKKTLSETQFPDLDE